jgi:hypothetical protein
MAQQDWIGVGILAGSMVMFALLLKVRLIRGNRLLLTTVTINPGLVGVAAACAFWLRDQPPWSTVFWVGAMLMTVPSTVAVMLAVPRAYLKQIQADIKAHEAEAERRQAEGAEQEQPGVKTPG